MHIYERAILRSYLKRLAAGKGKAWRKTWDATRLPQWLEVYRHELGLVQIHAAALLGFESLESASPKNTNNVQNIDADLLYLIDHEAPRKEHAIRRCEKGSSNFKSAERLDILGDALQAHLVKMPVTAFPSSLSMIERRLRWIADLVDLNAVERAILGLLVRIAVHEVSSQFAGALIRSFDTGELFECKPQEINIRYLQMLLGHSPGKIRNALSTHGSLRVFGLVRDAHGGDFEISNTTFTLMTERRLNSERAQSMLMGAPRQSRLDWADFSHLGEDGELVCGLVRKGLCAGEKGINILLHGAPGTGKTEFACAVAKRLGLKALFLGETDENGTEPERHDRVAALTMGQRLAAHVNDVLLVVDEADDLFVGVDDTSGSNRKGAKVFMNRLVDGTPRPTLWISNHPGILGQAVLRRMTFAVHFRQPGQIQRTRMIERISERQNFRLSRTEVAQLGALPAPAAVLDHGIRAARLCGGGAQTAIRSAASILTVMEGRVPQTQGEPAAFDEELSRADRDLKSFTAQILSSGRMKLSFCFAGAPGTGKSAFARHLAARMGLEVMERRASDVLGPYVGESEARIAAAFQEAEARKAFLIFDEADSLLQDRTKAVRSWEITQVNEMLTWMERHPLPFACTTNFVDSLDPATLRRFLFKVRFLPMESAQIRLAFRRFFGVEAPARLTRQEHLTAGDFAVVAGKAEVLGLSDPERLAEELLAEAAAKPEGKMRPIGFHAA